MANGRITSGGAGTVKTYTRDRGKIRVEGVAVAGADVTVEIQGEGGQSNNPDNAPGSPWSRDIEIAPGRYTLAVTIKRGDEQVKAFTQQIKVV